MSFLRSFVLGSFLLALLIPHALGQSSPAANPDPVPLKVMQQALERAMSSLSKADPAPYYISYDTQDQYGSIILASNGALVASIYRHERSADISVRVGNPELDNTHGEQHPGAIVTAAVPMDDKPDAIARVFWLNTDRMYQKASQTLLEGKTNTKVHADEEDSSADFSTEKPQVYIGQAALPPSFDQHAWEERIRRYSAIFARYPEIESSTVMLLVETQRATLFPVRARGS